MCICVVVFLPSLFYNPTRDLVHEFMHWWGSAGLPRWEPIGGGPTGARGHGCFAGPPH